jgi:hypothetical protein
MTDALPLAAWEEVVQELSSRTAAHLHGDPVLREAITSLAAGRRTDPVWETEDIGEFLFLDRLSRDLRDTHVPPLALDGMSPRIRSVLGNPTRFALDAACAVGAVTRAAVIAAVKEADARLQRATLGELPGGATRGRVDLAALRRFGIIRDERFRPLLIPPAPIITHAGGSEFAELKFVPDELEYDWVLMVRTADPRLPVIAKLPIDHRTARALTQFPAVVLDARLARGGRFDRVLDDARIRTIAGERVGVMFDPLRFSRWLRGLMN